MRGVRRRLPVLRPDGGEDHALRSLKLESVHSVGGQVTVDMGSDVSTRAGSIRNIAHARDASPA